jgi:hypothetical protein
MGFFFFFWKIINNFFLEIVCISSAEQNKVLPYFTENVPISTRATYYPPDITDEQFEGLNVFI